MEEENKKEEVNIVRITIRKNESVFIWRVAFRYHPEQLKTVFVASS